MCDLARETWVEWISMIVGGIGIFVGFWLLFTIISQRLRICTRNDIFATVVCVSGESQWMSYICVCSKFIK